MNLGNKINTTSDRCRTDYDEVVKVMVMTNLPITPESGSNPYNVLTDINISADNTIVYDEW